MNISKSSSLIRLPSIAKIFLPSSGETLFLLFRTEQMKLRVSEYVSAFEGGQILSMHSRYLPNLEKQGLIKSKAFGERGTRLYARADLESLSSR